MTGVRDLDQLLKSMEPELVDGEYVFVSVEGPMDRLDALAMVLEAEGTTYVLTRSEADQRGLAFDLVAAWITLRVHSALDAVGLTAAATGALADHGISCNVLAGRYHDHLLVPHHRGPEAVQILERLAREGTSTTTP